MDTVYTFASVLLLAISVFCAWCAYRAYFLGRVLFDAPIDRSIAVRYVPPFLFQSAASLVCAGAMQFAETKHLAAPAVLISAVIFGAWRSAIKQRSHQK